LDKLYGRTVVLDGSTLIGLALAEEHFESLKRAIINEQISPLTHELAVIELLYIICRKASMNIAKQKFDLLKGSGFINIIPTNMLLEDAASIKCRRKLALADCFTIALAVENKLSCCICKNRKGAEGRDKTRTICMRHAFCA